MCLVGETQGKLKHVDMELTLEQGNRAKLEGERDALVQRVAEGREQVCPQP